MTNEIQSTHNIIPLNTSPLKKYITNPALQNVLLTNQNKITNLRNIIIYIGGRYKTSKNLSKHIAFNSAYTITQNGNMIATLLTKNNNSPSKRQTIVTALLLALLTIPPNNTHTIDIKTNDKETFKQFNYITTSLLTT